jgi:hypothetical protein
LCNKRAFASGDNKYLHNAEKEGFLPIWALENLTDMYNTYKALGGNGAITGLYNKTIQLPQRKED